VGVAAGVGVWLFKWFIGLFQRVFAGGWMGGADQSSAWLLALAPVIGGLLVGLIAYYFISVERYHGVAGIMESVALAGGRLRYRRAPVKIFAAALGIGSGASVGPEDPSVQIGANLGSLAGQKLRLSDDGLRSLTAAGAAAGVSAAFNAPIAGVFFALEVILGEISGAGLGVVLLASVSAAVVTQAISGPQPAFHVPAYAMGSPFELPLYLVLGLLAGPLSAAYIRLLFLAQDVFSQWKAPRWVKPAAAGALVGGIGFFLPQVLGVGYATIERVLGGQENVIGLLMLLMLAKLVLTPVSIGGGFYGGVFAPSLYLGAMLGGAFGLLCQRWLPGAPVNPGAFAMVGMAAVLAGAVRAPLTAILLLFEMTNDYRIILPLMLTVVVSQVVSSMLEPHSVYTLGLARHGLRLERGRDVDVLDHIRVEDVMERQTPMLNENDNLVQAAQLLSQTHRHGLPVAGQDGRLVGVLTLQDIEQNQSSSETPIGQVCSRRLVVTYADEPLSEALRKMSPRELGNMPVVSREDSSRLVGWLRRPDVIRAYDIALTRRAVLRHQAQRVRLGAQPGEDVFIAEFVVQAGSPCAGISLKDIPLPAHSIVATLRRGRKIIAPNGQTILQAGDVLLVVMENQAHPAWEQFCQGQ
jgi:CIC family chloride channel protein